MTTADDLTQALDEAQSWQFLTEHRIGRLAIVIGGEPDIFPVNYVVDGRSIVFRTAEGSKLLGLTINDDVAFEIDEFGDEIAQSVVVRGRARRLEGLEADATDQLPLRPWIDTAKFNVIAIDVDEVHGRRFELARPWLHMRPVRD